MQRRSLTPKNVQARFQGYPGACSPGKIETQITGYGILGISQAKFMLIFITIYRVVLLTKSTITLYSYSTTPLIVILCVHAFQTLHTQKSSFVNPLPLSPLDLSLYCIFLAFLFFTIFRKKVQAAAYMAYRKLRHCMTSVLRLRHNSFTTKTFTTVKIVDLCWCWCYFSRKK